MTVKTTWPALRKAQQQGQLEIGQTVTSKGKTFVQLTVPDARIPGGRRPKVVEVVES
jgi:hypothetical protein